MLNESLGRMAPEAVETLVSAAIRFTPVQATCLAAIKPEHFSGLSEAPLRVLWRAVLNVAQLNGGLLPAGRAAYSALTIELANIISDGVVNVQLTSDVFLNPTTGLLPLVFSWEEAMFDENVIRSYLQLFMRERNNDLLFTLVDKNKEFGITDARDVEIKRLMTEMEAVRVSEDKIFKSPFPTPEDLVQQDKFARISTGIEWLDKKMGGGHCPQQCYVALGPSGVGKTILAGMLCVQGARQQNAEVMNKRIDKAGVWYLITWEQVRREMMWRLLSYASLVPTYRLQMSAKDGYKTLKGPGEQLETYEQRLLIQQGYGAKPDEWPCEQQRVRNAFNEIENGVAIIDCSGDEPGLTTAGPQELGRYIQNRIRSRGQPCAGVVLDWAGLYVERKTAGKSNQKEALTTGLVSFVPEVVQHIAIPCNCPVWAFHQLSGEAAKMAPTARQSHTRAAYSSGFGWNAWFAFAFGTKDDANNCCCIWASKTRDAESDAEGTVLKIEGQVAWLRDASMEYEADTTTRRFIPKYFSQRLVSPKASQPAAPQPMSAEDPAFDDTAMP